jgi:hypothetical protein
MSIRWWWWTLGAVGCILLGTIWSSLSNPAVLPGLRVAVLNFGEWVETHHGALTLLATLFIAAFTGTLRWSTRQLWKAGEQQIALAKQTSEATQSVLGQTRVIERAYVKLSHEPPGVRFERMDMTIHIKLRVKNFGRTPAYVTDVILTPVILAPGERLPEVISYRGTEVYPLTRAFLVAEDKIFTHVVFPLSEREYEGVWAGQLTLHVIGFVDYVDAFRVRHRGGYARTYTPDLQNNLTFATDNSAHNFDVVRSPGVGRDWTLSR